jgi:hypothetical protein
LKGSPILISDNLLTSKKLTNKQKRKILMVADYMRDRSAEEMLWYRE